MVVRLRAVRLAFIVWSKVFRKSSNPSADAKEAESEFVPVLSTFQYPSLKNIDTYYSNTEVELQN